MPSPARPSAVSNVTVPNTGAISSRESPTGQNATTSSVAPSVPGGGDVFERTPSASARGKLSNSWDLKSGREVWTTTFWPYCDDQRGTTVGNPTRNLWAKKGCLEKFDELLQKRGLDVGAREHELVPALNFLRNDGTPSGYYIPESRIREYDAERTTGVDFTNTGSLDSDVEIDFLDDNSLFGTNGQTDGVLRVGWWGSCDKVALASLLFQNPKRDVTIDGITFTTQDIRGLLTVVAGSQAGTSEYTGWKFWGKPDTVELKDGTVHVGKALNVKTRDCLRGEFDRHNGNQITVKKLDIDVEQVRFKTGSKTVTFPVSEVVSFTREDKQEPSASDFHVTVKRWLREKRPFALDRDSGSHVWNISVDQAVIDKTREIPSGFKVDDLVGFNGPYSGGDLCLYAVRLKAGGSDKESYRYWIEKRDGEHVNSGWRGDNPAFLWRPVVGEPRFEGPNDRNPFVDPAIVKEIFEMSMKEEPKPEPVEPSIEANDTEALRGLVGGNSEPQPEEDGDLGANNEGAPSSATSTEDGVDLGPADTQVVQPEQAPPAPVSVDNTSEVEERPARSPVVASGSGLVVSTDEVVLEPLSIANQRSETAVSRSASAVSPLNSGVSAELGAGGSSSHSGSILSRPIDGAPGAEQIRGERVGCLPCSESCTIL